jgi:hypothetical protein
MLCKAEHEPAAFRIDAADIVGANFRVDFRDRCFVIRVSGDRIEVLEPKSSELIGAIRRGSPRSGAIWKHSRCIGEYSLEGPSGSYVVIPIASGHKEPELMRAIDPLIYLLGELAASDSGFEGFEPAASA